MIERWQSAIANYPFVMDPRKPHCSRDDAVRVVGTLRDAGHVAYFAGGCVRDMLLGLAPSDFDIATDAPPDRVRALFNKTQAVGQAFGVILVRLNKSVVEVATFRAEGAYHDGRRPSEVRFTSAEEDARRRDFTINGLFFDPIEDRVIDFVGGQRDLADHVLRAIGNPNERFAEDHLRLLRAVRFAARFDLQIEEQTRDAIAHDAALLPRISGERIADELRRMLCAPTRRNAFRALWSLRLIQPALTLAPPSDLKLDDAKSLLLHLPNDRPLAFALVLLASLVDLRWQSSGRKHDILGNFAQAEMSKIVSPARSALKLSNDEADAMIGIGRFIHELLNAREPSVALMKRSLARPTAYEALLLLDAIRAAGNAVDRIDALKARLAPYIGTDCAPAPLLTGDHLVRAGYSPGPAFKRVLDAVYDAQLEARVSTFEQAMGLAEQLLK